MRSSLVVTNPSAACVETLEARWLLSVAHTAHLPIDIVGQYDATAQVTFSPAKSRAPAPDSIALLIGTEAANGKVQGTLTDALGGDASVSGRLRGTRLALSVTNPRTSGDRGSILLKVSSDGKLLTGKLRESHRSGKSVLRWHGALALSATQSPSTTANPPGTTPTKPLATGHIDLLGRYTGSGSGTYMFNPDDPPIPYDSAVSLSITSQSSDGKVIGSLGGFAAQGAATGILSGSTLTLQSTDGVISTTATFQVYADGSLSGTISTSAPLLYQSFNGTATLQKLPPPAQIVGTYTGMAQVTDIVGGSGSETAPITLIISTELPDGSLTGELDAFGLSAPLMGAVTDSNVTLGVVNSDEHVSITATAGSSSSQLSGQIDELDQLLPHEWKGTFSIQRAE